MLWFFIALIGPLMYAITNHIDKFLLEKYFKNGGVGTLLLFSSLFSIFVLPFIYLADKTVFSVSGIHIIALAVVGILNVLVLLFYFIALQNEEASVTIVFYQLMPVFGYILSYFILGETLTQLQIIAMIIIISGTTIVSFEIDSDNKFKLRKKTILPMLAASFFWALESVIFKAVALEENFLRSLFWEHLMMLTIGIIIFIFISSYRKTFILAIKNNSKKILFLNSINEFLYVIGSLAFTYATLIAPVALVLLSDSFQSIFVLIIGIVLTIFFPKIAVEKINKRHIWTKIIAIILTGIGTYLLFM
ncbi:MAG: EamA family transporter [Candidatus Paceibacterota bacterium]